MGCIVMGLQRVGQDWATFTSLLYSKQRANWCELNCKLMTQPCAVLSCQLFVTPWTVACRAPLSVGFSRQEYQSGLPCPPSEPNTHTHCPWPGLVSQKPQTLKLAFSWTFSITDWQARAHPLLLSPPMWCPFVHILSLAASGYIWPLGLQSLKYLLCGLSQSKLPTSWFLPLIWFSYSKSVYF